MGSKNVEGRKEMKHSRRAQRAGNSGFGGPNHENLRKMKPFGSLGEAWAGHAEPGLAARLSPQPGWGSIEMLKMVKKHYVYR